MARSYVTDILGTPLTAVNFGAFISGLSQIASLDQTNDLLVLFDATDSQAKSIRWTGRFESNPDGANYSVTPYTPFGRNRLNVFTAAQNHIIEFPAGLSTTPPVYGAFMAPPANTLTLRRVAASGVSINGVADDGFTWVVPAGGAVFWWLIDTNTVWLWGDFSGTQVVSDDVLLEGSASGGGLVPVTRGAGSTQPTVADSSKHITTDGAVTIPNTAIGDGWFHCTLEVGAATHDISHNSLILDISTEGIAAGDILTIITKSASAIRVVGAAGTFTEADFA